MKDDIDIPDPLTCIIGDHHNPEGKIWQFKTDQGKIGHIKIRGGKMWMDIVHLPPEIVVKMQRVHCDVDLVEDYVVTFAPACAIIQACPEIAETLEKIAARHRIQI